MHAVKPLPFDPKKLAGLSEKLLVSHHDNNYAGAVRNLNGVEAALSCASWDTVPWKSSPSRAGFPTSPWCGVVGRIMRVSFHSSQLTALRLLELR